MTVETPLTVAMWAQETFGEVRPFVAAARANEEMAELLTATTLGDVDKVGEELADVIIVLYHLAGSAGIDVQEEIDRKMRINRGRNWRKTDRGTGYHEDQGRTRQDVS